MARTSVPVLVTRACRKQIDGGEKCFSIRAVRIINRPVQCQRSYIRRTISFQWILELNAGQPDREDYLRRRMDSLLVRQRVQPADRRLAKPCDIIHNKLVLIPLIPIQFERIITISSPAAARANSVPSQTSS